MGLLDKLDEALTDFSYSVQYEDKKFDYEGAIEKVQELSNSFNEAVEKRRDELEKEYYMKKK